MVRRARRPDSGCEPARVPPAGDLPRRHRARDARAGPAPARPGGDPRSSSPRASSCSCAPSPTAADTRSPCSSSLCILIFCVLGALLTWRVEYAHDAPLVLRRLRSRQPRRVRLHVARSARTSPASASPRSRSRCSSSRSGAGAPCRWRRSCSCSRASWNLSPHAWSFPQRDDEHERRSALYWQPAVELPAHAPDAVLPGRGGRHRGPLGGGLPAASRASRSRAAGSGRTTSRRTRCSTTSSTGRRTSRWLRSLGVRYVVLTDAPTDYSSKQEALLIRSGRSGLIPVHEHEAHHDLRGAATRGRS